ncbi:MAG: DinB family protein [Flavobacteriaceae bacterium]|nr:DinB family protein [Flavobacteriaceae bacterium]
MTVKDLNINEFNSYYSTYINLVGENISLFEGLKLGQKQTSDFIESIDENKMGYAYDEGKWTIKEVVQHIIDCERVFTFRAFCISRNDKAEFPGFDQDEYVSSSEANKKTKLDLLNEYNTQRTATIAMFESLNETMLKNKGTASNSILSTRAAGFIIIGHELHHCNVIQEKYL